MIKWLKSLFGKKQPAIPYQKNLKVKSGDRIAVNSEEEMLSVVLSTALNSDKPVFGSVEDGVLTVNFDEDGEDE